MKVTTKRVIFLTTLILPISCYSILICPESTVYNHLQIYGNLGGLESFKNDPRYELKTNSDSAPKLMCDNERIWFRNDDIIACDNVDSHAVGCPEIIFARNRGTLFSSNVVFVQLFYRNYSCELVKPQPAIKHVDIKFGELKEGQKFLILSLTFGRTFVTENIKIEVGLNVMINNSKVLDYEGFVNISCELLKVLKSDYNTICSEKTIKELILSCFGKNLTTNVDCTNHAKSECKKITALTEEEEDKVGIFMGSKRSNVKEKLEEQEEARSHLEFYFTCFCLLFFLVLVGLYNLFKKIN